MEWHPNSPDMNPIEHIWRALKAKLYARFPDTYAIRGGPETVRAELEWRLQIVWNELESEVIEKLITKYAEALCGIVLSKRMVHTILI